MHYVMYMLRVYILALYSTLFRAEALLFIGGFKSNQILLFSNAHLCPKIFRMRYFYLFTFQNVTANFDTLVVFAVLTLHN